MGFFTESVKDIEEMAAPKMPMGVKRKRSATYAHTHDIHIGGKHVATISGHQANRRMDGRGLPAHAKIYQIHHNEAGMLKAEPHKEHSYTRIEQRPTWKDDKNKPNGGNWDYEKTKATKIRKHIEHHSMEDAINAVHNTHKNNELFGHGHDPRDRWKHAIKMASGHDEHEKKAAHYKTALHHVSMLGHEDATSALQHHADAHAAKASKPSKESLKQWTHDAHHYTSTTHHYAKFDGNTMTHKAHDAPNYPDHHELATQAHNVHVHGHPDGSEWDRKRKAEGHTMVGARGY